MGRISNEVSEKLEIIRLVEQSHLPTKRTIDKLGIPRTTFYRWYDKYLIGGIDALKDRSPKPLHVWNRIPDDVRQQIVDLALEETELSPRELARAWEGAVYRYTAIFCIRGQCLQAVESP